MSVQGAVYDFFTFERVGRGRGFWSNRKRRNGFRKRLGDEK